MIPKELLAPCRGARTRYEQYLAESKKEHQASKCARQRKAVLEEIKEKKVEKMKIEKIVEVLEKEADSLSLEAEKKESFQTFPNANALRVKTKSVRSEELAVVSQSLFDLEKELKSMVD